MFGTTAGASARTLASSSGVTLNGAGSTLVAPLEAEWASAWDSSTGNTVNYNPVGSGQGYQDIADGLVDFGASDAPLSVYSSPTCHNCVQIPWALTATGISFHVNNITSLKMTGGVLAQIYLGKITHWNNSQIKALNPGKNLPDLKIAVFWRSDASGDSYAFTQYESDVNGTFKKAIGGTVQPSFPVGTGELHNSGMASAIQATNGGIGYVAVSYLINAGLPAMSIRNAAGKFVLPNLSNIEAAAQAVHSVPSNNQVTIVDPPASAPSAYVISTFTYVIVPTTASKGTPLKQFIFYALTGGQQFGPALDFARIPTVVLKASESTLNKIH
jgi:phosphate transport system substrate-binding protein